MGGRQRKDRWLELEEQVLSCKFVNLLAFLQYAYSHVSRFHKWRIRIRIRITYHVSVSCIKYPLTLNNHINNYITNYGGV